MNKISEIRFKVLQDSVLIDPERQTHTAVKGHREHVWALGLGPCGREVSQLEYEISLVALTIRQTSHPKGFAEDCDRLMKVAMSLPRVSDEHYKAIDAYHALMETPKVERFVYPLDQIVGRIRALE